jgi:hypothetical protein
MLNLASLHITLQNSRVSKTQWRCHLGHASPQIIQKLISQFDLPCLAESNKYICDTCQQVKIPQLPYYLSNNLVSSPLKLIYSDLWGPAHTIVHGEKYYVSFVDAYIRFTYEGINLMLLLYFIDSKPRLSVLLKRKLKLSKLTREGNIRNFIPSLTI